MLSCEELCDDAILKDQVDASAFSELAASGIASASPWMRACETSSDVRGPRGVLWLIKAGFSVFKFEPSDVGGRPRHAAGASGRPPRV